jgi:hypothetical protein
MAVSGKTAAPFEIPYFLSTDHPPDMGAVTKAMAERLHALIAGRSTLIATEQSRESAAYGTLTTPDKVEGIVLPEKGLICVAFSAIWRSTVENAARAAIFLGGNQLKVPRQGETPVTQAAINRGAVNENHYLTSAPIGLLSSAGGAGSSGTVTTGTALASLNSAAEATHAEIGGADKVVEAAAGSDYAFQGGICYIHANAGTYEIGIQFKATSGAVVVKNRRLYVWTQKFA